jgi:hypothetical protein
VTKSHAPLRAVRGGSEASAVELRARVDLRLDDALAAIAEARADLDALAEMVTRPTDMAVQRRLFTDVETAEILGIGKSTVNALRLKGKLVGVKKDRDVPPLHARGDRRLHRQSQTSLDDPVLSL